jgi:hypothetical protein
LFDSHYVLFVVLVKFLAAVEAAEPFVMIEAILVQTEILEVHSAVILAWAWDLRKTRHFNDYNLP